MLFSPSTPGAEPVLTGVVMGLGPGYVGVLEGPEDKVLQVLERIATDQRNNGMVVVHEALVTNRRFSGMAIHEVTTGNEDVPLGMAAQLLVSKLSTGLRKAA